MTYEQSELVGLRAVAQVQLGAVVRQDHNAARRSAAANLLGVLALSLAAIDDSLRPTLLSNAAADFRRAVRFDPESDDAKYNLELVLDTLLGVGRRRWRNGLQGGRTFNQGAGAGSGREGSGY